MAKPFDLPLLNLPIACFQTYLSAINVLLTAILSGFADSDKLYHGSVSGSLPAEVGQLVKLETLLANNNRLTHLPGTLSNLRSLRDVSLASNQLKSFPTQLCALKNLSSLDLSHNQITEIPPEVKGLGVVELNCNRNQVITNITLYKLYSLLREPFQYYM